MSTVKTILLLVGAAVGIAGIFKVKGLSHGLAFGIVLVLVGSVIPESSTN